MDNSAQILRVRNLTVQFQMAKGTVHAVNDIDFWLNNGETLGIVGESGSGKSVTIKSIMRLLPSAATKIPAGEIIYKGEDLLKLSEDRMREIRGKEIAMIFQNPMTAFNPVLPIGKQIAESIEFHEDVTAQERKNRVLELLREVGISNPEYRALQYPHEFSGGMLQRAMIASSLVCSPKIVLADEPTTGLDVTIQAQIIRLIKQIKETRQMSLIWITHDLSLLAGLADRIAVMYGGRIVEQADVDALYERPLHPYTQGILASIPTLSTDRSSSLFSIPGLPPNPMNLPQGCAFSARCKQAMTICGEKVPTLKERKNNHLVACWLYESECGENG